MKIFPLSLSLLIPLIFASACGPRQDLSKQHEAWDYRNDPTIMGFDYLKREYKFTNILSELPKKGKLSKLPWSSGYWPSYRGGITFRWQAANQALGELYRDHPEATDSEAESLTEKFYSFPLGDLTGIDNSQLSPAEKYDLYLGNESFTLTKEERDRTGIMHTVKGSSEFIDGWEIPTWYGLCHAWAPATLLYKPVTDVTMSSRAGENIHFTAGDIQALLTAFLDRHDGNDTQFLGGRCDFEFEKVFESFKKGEITREDYLRKVRSSECRDTNAGAFHLVLTNQIGRLDEGFVIDVTRDAQVWNQPVVAYEYRILKSEAPNEQAAPGTKRMLLVQTVMFYVSEVSPNQDGAPEGYHYDQKMYVYYLELDADGKIIGGQWYNDRLEEQPNFAENIEDDRPDFMWKRSAPKFTGYFAELKKIYEKASAAYPERGFRALDPVKDMDNYSRRNIRDFWRYGLELIGGQPSESTEPNRTPDHATLPAPIELGASPTPAAEAGVSVNPGEHETQPTVIPNPAP